MYCSVLQDQNGVGGGVKVSLGLLYTQNNVLFSVTGSEWGGGWGVG